jgi:iron-sulfur-dependent L-serine dehydratase beta subunit
VCKGKRYNRETLEVRFRGANIADVLDMTVEDACAFFENQPRIRQKLETLLDVGLGYIHLGQSATTLSGGEAQRVKLATELSKRDTGRTFYILDEPTTGLHFEDVRLLLRVLHRLVDKGNTVLVIEHNLDVIKTADWIVDLGPEGGSRGGTIVAEGTPEQVATVSASHTGRFLRPLLGAAEAGRRAGGRAPRDDARYIPRMVSLLDIIGPVMVGPSSSHTAGACRIGLLARGLVGGTPERARIELHGSFARTGEGHGTDKAIVGGLLGFRPDDERLRTALDIMEQEGLDYRFEKTTLDDEAHPNTARLTVERGGAVATVVGSSVGAGRIRLTEIDGYPVEVTGNLHTIVLVAEDRPGSVARIAGILADERVNLATMRVTRKERGGDAFMVIECDDAPSETARDAIATLDWVRWARLLDKVSA